MANQQEIDKKMTERIERTEEHIRQSEAREEKLQHLFRHGLHILEKMIAVFTLVVLLGAFGKLILELIRDPGSSADVTGFLHEVLTIVVGLEFVRMLIDTTPASILEVLAVAITRHVILSHDDPVSNLLSVACIAGLFAIRRYLFRRGELKEEMVEKE
mgnify:FL=1